MPSNFHYNKNLKHFARKLRSEPTRGEEILWYNILQNRKMKGYRFLRQRSILNYVVDFFCKELMLIIEVDGYTHDDKVEEDRIRDQKFKESGYHILRIPDGEVFNDLENVIRGIEDTIEKIISKMEQAEL